jgi:hypothetical protein
MLINWYSLYSKRGEAVNHNSLLVAARSREVDVRRRTALLRPRILCLLSFPKESRRKAVSLFFYQGMRGEITWLSLINRRKL